MSKKWGQTLILNFFLSFCYLKGIGALALSFYGVRLGRGVPFGMACCSVQPGNHLLEGGLHEALIQKLLDLSGGQSR